MNMLECAVPRKINQDQYLKHLHILGLNDRPVKRGNQWTSPAMMANTAPIDNT
jgi:hypothetical protein